jgi:ABC-type glycerol-3-phosphate transport system substrate-binding protein
VISAIVASKPAEADAARAFVRFLATPDAARTFAASGLLAVKPASPN